MEFSMGLVYRLGFLLGTSRSWLGLEAMRVVAEKTILLKKKKMAETSFRSKNPSQNFH